MKNLLLIVVAGLVLVALGGTGWLLLSDSLVEPLAGSGEEEASPGQPDPATPTNSETSNEDAAGSLAGSLQTTDEGRQDLGSEAPEGQVRVSGMVRAPFTAPEDRELEAFALASSSEYDEFREALRLQLPEELDIYVLDRVPVESDGSFELLFPAEQEDGWVMVAGRYLYSMEAQLVDLDESQTIEVIPAMGCFISGTLTAPTLKSQGKSLAGIKLAIDLDQFALNKRPDPRNTVKFDFASDAEGRFELRALPTEYTWTLSVLPEQFAAQTITLEELVGGEDIEVAVELDEGGSISGVVLDPAGDPVPEATVRALLVGGTFGFDDEKVGETSSDAEGLFELTAMPVGSVSLKADHRDFLESKRVDVAVEAGVATQNVEIRVVEGGKLTGRVIWPDGTPATGVEVHAEFDQAYLSGLTAFNALRGAEGETITADDGRFEINGMGGGPFVLTCEARPLDLPPHPHESEEPEDRSAWFSVRAESVQPGSDIELLLHPPLGITGQVTDEKKNAPAKFTVHAVRKAKGGFGPVGMEQRHEPFESEDGSFFLGDLTEGSWELTIESEGYVSPARKSVAVPSEGTILFPVVRAASISGQVLTPTGAPVASATVTVDLGIVAFQNTMATIDNRPTVETDESGLFKFENLPPGSTGLIAKHEDYCESEPVPFELTAGARYEEAEIRLRAGGQLTGLVYDKSGEFAAGFLVVLNSPEMRQIFSKTNSDGEFEIDHVPPGHWQVVAMNSGNDYSTDTDGGNAGLMNSMLLSQAEITEGESTHVIIGAPPQDPVKITGQVTHDGEPFVGANLIFFQEGTRLYENMKFASFGENGHYTATVDGPGTYVVFLQKMGRTQVQQQNVEFTLDVPLVEEFEHDFEVPLGRISGVVKNSAGEPVPDARVTIATDGGFRSDVLMGGQYSEVQTDAQGRYDLVGLRPGTYLVAAGGAMLLDVSGSSPTTVGRVTRGGVRLSENEWKQDFDFELQAPGAVEVYVLGIDGTPLEGAGIFLRDSDGRPLEPFNMATTKSTGYCLIQGIAPGDYTVVARKGLYTSQESPPFRVGADATKKVELRVEEGTILWIKLKDSDGEAVRASVSVRDTKSGQDWSAFFGMEDLQVLYLEGEFSPTEHRLGPLPPGKYRVEAKSANGSKSKPVTVRGEPERKITMRLK